MLDADLPKLPTTWLPKSGGELAKLPPRLMEMGLRDDSEKSEEFESCETSDALELVAQDKNRFLLFLYKHNSRIASAFALVSMSMYASSVFLTDVYWRTIAAVIGILNMAIGIFCPQKEQTPEEIEALIAMDRCSYVGLRMKQILDPVNHKRQTMAFGHVLVGIPMGVAGITTGRHSEVVSMCNLAVGGALFGLPITDGGGWSLFSVYSFFTYVGAIGIYGAVLAGKEGDWASVVGEVFGISSVVLPLGVTACKRRHEIKQAEGVIAKAKVLFR